jgi:hypothetical protein
LIKLYTDLKGKGLEIVGVTRLYGYIGQERARERDMPADTEFAKMGDFIKEKGLLWPVIFGGNDNFSNYGVSGIPHVTVIDRTGKVHSFKIGYSPESFANFRKEIEDLLGK